MLKANQSGVTALVHGSVEQTQRPPQEMTLMNRTPLAAFMLAALSGAAWAQSSVTIFGVVDANVRYVDNDSAGDLWSLSPDGLQGSRIGFRGLEDLGGGLKAGFWLELA